YRCNCQPITEACMVRNVTIGRFLNLLDQQLEGKGKEYLCGTRYSAADIHFYELLKMLIIDPAKWVLTPGRR
ncbi:hypothetical protein BKA60DRAFT_418700, partial [Fusarium oxysporum]